MTDAIKLDRTSIIEVTNPDLADRLAPKTPAEQLKALATSAAHLSRAAHDGTDLRHRAHVAKVNDEIFKNATAAGAFDKPTPAPAPAAWLNESKNSRHRFEGAEAAEAARIGQGLGINPAAWRAGLDDQPDTIERGLANVRALWRDNTDANLATVRAAVARVPGAKEWLAKHGLASNARLATAILMASKRPAR